MRVVIDGQSFENPRLMRIEVEPAGETIVGPLIIEIAGGWLYLEPGTVEPWQTVEINENCGIDSGPEDEDKLGQFQETAAIQVRAVNRGAGIFVGDSLATHDPD